MTPHPCYKPEGSRPQTMSNFLFDPKLKPYTPPSAPKNPYLFKPPGITSDKPITFHTQNRAISAVPSWPKIGSTPSIAPQLTTVPRWDSTMKKTDSHFSLPQSVLAYKPSGSDYKIGFKVSDFEAQFKRHLPSGEKDPFRPIITRPVSFKVNTSDMYRHMPLSMPSNVSYGGIMNPHFLQTAPLNPGFNPNSFWGQRDLSFYPSSSKIADQLLTRSTPNVELAKQGLLVKSAGLCVKATEGLLKCCTVYGANQCDVSFEERRAMIEAVDHKAAAVGVVHGASEFMAQLWQFSTQAATILGADGLDLSFDEKRGIVARLTKHQVKQLQNLARFYQHNFEVLKDNPEYQLYKRGTQFLLEYGPMIPLAGRLTKDAFMATRYFLPSSKIMDSLFRSAKANAIFSEAVTSVKLERAALTSLQDLSEVGFIQHIEHLKKAHVFNFSKPAFGHMQDRARWVPMSLMKQVIEHPLAVVPDPRKVSRANMYYAQMSRNGKIYNIEVLYDPIENEISHFKYTDDALGPLNKIRK